MLISRKVLTVDKLGQQFSVKTDAVEVRILFMTDDIVRIRAGFDGDFKEISYSLVTTAWEDGADEMLASERRRIEPAGAALSEEQDCYILQGSKLKIRINKEPFMLQVWDAEGTLIHEDIPYMGWQCDSNSRRIHTTMLEPADAFFGFGERTGKLNKRLKFMHTAPGDTMGYDPVETDALYKHIPFYIKVNKDNKKATGYFYHTTYECDFDMGRTHSNYVKHHSQVRIDGGDIDLFLIAGPQVSDVIERYTDLTGKSVMLPKAALGYLGSSMYYSELPVNVDDEIVNFIKTNKEEVIPIDGFQLSSGYCEIDNGEGMKRYCFTWNEDKFHDPAEFFTRMTDLGITVSPNVKPGFLLSHPFLSDMSDKDMFIKDSASDEDAVGLWWGGMGKYVDLTNPDTRSNWKAYLKQGLLDYGVTSIWNDNCEYEGLMDKDARTCLEGMGGTVGQIKPVMSNIMCQLSHEAVHEVDNNRRAFAVCRSGHAGIQRYAQTWAGDNLTCWEGVKYNIATILGMGLSGVANHGCDIGGFYGPAPEEELFVRWVQNGIFQPRFSIHSTNIDNTVTEPWMYSGTKHLIRDAIKFRYRLEPYFYSLMYRAHTLGLPILEPYVYAFQNDTRAYDESVNFLLGDSLLVANVVEKGATTREIYLPEGEVFYDFKTRERYEGGQTITIPVTLESIPMFVRGGAIIPMDNGQMMNLTNDVVTDLRTLCSPDKDNEFTMYDDDGATMQYQNGDYCKTHISMHAGQVVTLDFTSEGNYSSPVKSLYVDMIARTKAPFYIKLKSAAGEQELKHYLKRSDFEAGTNCWYYSQTLKSVQIKYDKPEGDYTLLVSFENFDMIGM